MRLHCQSLPVAVEPIPGKFIQYYFGDVVHRRGPNRSAPHGTGLRLADYGRVPGECFFNLEECGEEGCCGPRT
jgi:hypothetical protein